MGCYDARCVVCSRAQSSEFGSMERAIVAHLRGQMGGEKFAFTWIGGEDRTSMVRGSGRPFLVKIRQPMKRDISVRDADFGATITGYVMAGYFVGSLVGSIVTPKLIEQVGHIRVFAAFASIISTTTLREGESRLIRRPLSALRRLRDPFQQSKRQTVQGACPALVQSSINRLKFN